ncbi:MAG TPA: IS110 family transposase [Thermoanaerobaculia bacterium]|jgi:transposase|nr:IS110 family transposase [Thermoanaerobaculia bacterium]
MKQPQFVGIDVSARHLSIGIEDDCGTTQQLDLPNTPTGHQQLIKRLRHKGSTARVCLEWTGNYSLDLALALHHAPNLEVMVVNPKAAHNFAEAFLQRAKTDAIDARILLEFAKRMPFRAWQPPSSDRLQLRALGRRISALTQMKTQEKNRLHSTEFGQDLHQAIRHDVEAHIRHLEHQIQKLEQAALDLIWDEPQLRKDLLLLTSIKGIARTSAIHILSELCVLPSDMTDRQWVAHAGLDPRHHESGTSVHKVAHISRIGNRHLRAALYMPALTAVQFDPHIRAYYQTLLQRGKQPMQALVAVMRKLLHSIHAMLRDGADFQGQLFFALETPDS